MTSHKGFTLNEKCPKVLKCLCSTPMFSTRAISLLFNNYNLFSEPLGAGNYQSLTVENYFITIIQYRGLEWLQSRHCGNESLKSVGVYPFVCWETCRKCWANRTLFALRPRVYSSSQKTKGFPSGSRSCGFMSVLVKVMVKWSVLCALTGLENMPYKKTDELWCLQV